MNGVELTIFSSRITAICDEMGALLQRSAFSPNIRDRLDFSCALFDAEGELCAQAAHIPVHLGSMAYAMRDIVSELIWRPGDLVVLNDPYLGGTHLPDVTMITPLFIDQERLGFVVNRAHHADIGSATPGSMPLSTTLEQEGVVIPPTYLMREGKLQRKWFDELLQQMRDEVVSRGDFEAQMSANQVGERRLREWIEEIGADYYRNGVIALNDYAEKLAAQQLSTIPDGVYCFEDRLDGDGQGSGPLTIRAKVVVEQGVVEVDFSGTAAQSQGNVNAPLSVAAAGVYYLFRTLMPPQIPATAGSFRAITIRAEPGSLPHATRPAAVAAGNVETSSRVVDVVMGALAKAVPERMAAASQGTMNNLAMGGEVDGHHWDYYETMGGGMGAWNGGAGLSAVQSHMTNTLNTPIEVLEMMAPVRVEEYRLRRGSGGGGEHCGGDGLVRTFRFLQPTTVTLLSERRDHSPWGMAGGSAGKCGVNELDERPLPGKFSLRVEAGQQLRISTPGGGGYGRPE